MPFNPASLDLKKLFAVPGMFDSNDSFRAAGFAAVNRGPYLIMVGSHKEAQGYLFKKYRNHISLKEQHKNYVRRIEGVQKLRAFIAKRRLQHIVAPQKWLYELPRSFSSHGRSSYVLIVERLMILDEEASKQKYRHISKDVLRELCTVLVKFRGLDSTARNMVFTEAGQIAFVDTENWDRRKKSWLRYIGPQLSKKRLALAEEIFDDFGDR